MPIIRITEAQTKVSHNSFTGRGGAGNYRHLPAPPTAAAPVAVAPSAAPAPVDAPPASSNQASGPSLPKATTSHYARGGAGNIYTASERPMFFFDEELERMYARDEHCVPVYHIGRGGAGNLVSGPPTSFATAAQPTHGVRPSGDSGRRSSNGSADSEARGKFSGDEVLRRLSQTFSRRS